MLVPDAERVVVVGADCDGSMRSVSRNIIPWVGVKQVVGVSYRFTGEVRSFDPTADWGTQHVGPQQVCVTEFSSCHCAFFRHFPASG